MVLNGGLFACDDPAHWRDVLSVYWDVVVAKAKKQQKLIALDKWYQDELPVAIAGRNEKYFTKEELVKLMEWKLSRGKFCPRLQRLVATNSGEAVESCTKKAFQCLPDIAAAVTELTKLKAVGPATASAILAAGAPELAAFMADEVLESIPGLTPVQYTLKHYMLYQDKIQTCVKRLNKAEAEQTWTPHKVELSLWTWAIGQKLHLSPLLTRAIQRDKPGGGEEEEDRPSKKQKAT